MSHAALDELRELISASNAKVRVGYPFWLRPFLQRGVIGITLGRSVFISPKMIERGDEEVRRLVRHELAHVRQVQQLGLIRFLVRYVREYFRHRRNGMSRSQAYAEISFEKEALVAEMQHETS
jgi:hypothetical protein